MILGRTCGKDKSSSKRPSGKTWVLTSLAGRSIVFRERTIVFRRRTIFLPGKMFYKHAKLFPVRTYLRPSQKAHVYGTASWLLQKLSMRNSGKTIVVARHYSPLPGNHRHAGRLPMEELEQPAGNFPQNFPEAIFEKDTCINCPHQTTFHNTFTWGVREIFREIFEENFW